MRNRWRWKRFMIPAVLCMLLSCSGPVRVHQGVTGIYYEVKPGDTLSRISRTYGVNATELAAANRLKNLDHLTPGTVLFIPKAQTARDRTEPSAGETEEGLDKPRSTVIPTEPQKGHVDKATDEGKQGPKKEPTGKPGKTVLKKTADKDARKTPSPASTPELREEPHSRPLWKDNDPGPEPAPTSKPPRKESAPATEDEPTRSKATLPPVPPRPPTAAIPPNTVSEKGRFSWPLRGTVDNRYGLQPNGMYFNHIRIAAKGKGPVIVAAPGTVIFSAPLREFGETIIVKHDQRFATVYTHLDTRTVKTDQQLKGGETIGLAKAIHFEIRDRNKSRDPLLFLP
jgi:lipoprotein NlpD